MYEILDFHAHVLPTADHGSDSIETTLFQLESAKSYGVERIVATPHFYPNAHSVDSFLARRNQAYNILKPYLNDSTPDIKLGAEVLICEEIENLPGIDRLFIEGTDTLLLELPFTKFQRSFIRSVKKLLSRGVNVVLAHADRYASDGIESLVELGAKIQLNADSLVSLFKRRVLYDWLKRGLVVALGSDIHGKDKRAYANFARAKSRIAAYLPDLKAASDAIWQGSN